MSSLLEEDEINPTHAILDQLFEISSLYWVKKQAWNKKVIIQAISTLFAWVKKQAWQTDKQVD